MTIILALQFVTLFAFANSPIFENHLAEVTLILEEKLVAEPAKHPNWIIVKVNCKNSARRDYKKRVSVCDSDLNATFKRSNLRIDYYDWDPYRSTDNFEGRIYCNRDTKDIQTATIDLNKLCK